MSGSAIPSSDHLSVQTSHSTPIRRKSQGTSGNEPVKQSSQQRHSAMAQELSNEWLGPMPLDLFFKEYMFISDRKLKNMPHIRDNYFDVIPKGKETEMYTSFINLVKKSKLMPGFYMADTHSTSDRNADEGNKLQPDICVYKGAPPTTEVNKTRFDEVELLLEFKSASSSAKAFDDTAKSITSSSLAKPDKNPTKIKATSSSKPGEDPVKSKTPSSTKPVKNSPGSSLAGFEPDGNLSTQSRGQIASYLTEMVNRQYRTHAFLVFFGDPEVRFIKTQRVGTVVSESFDFRTNQQPLAEFLWRFANITDSARGHDPTVRRATRTEEDEAREALRHDHEPKYIRPFVVLTVPERGKPDREVVAWGSLADAHSLHGRATRVWPVFDLKTKQLALLKDTWRPVEDNGGTESEVDILEELTKAGVPNIPKLVCGGDIPGQTSVKLQYKGAPWITPALSPSVWITRTHTRVLTDVIGRPLGMFTSSKQMLKAIADALAAHKAACEMCHILHRDVSVNNILILKDGGGILNDWDMSRRISPTSMARFPHRTGTWAFMSIKLLARPNASHTIEDDLESFCYVFIYTALRYLQHNHGKKLVMIVKKVFGSFIHDPYGNAYGGDGKMGIHNTIGDSSFTDNPAMTACIKAILAILYDVVVWNAASSAKLNSPTASNPLDGHSSISDIFDAHLTRDDWPTDDAAKDHYAILESELEPPVPSVPMAPLPVPGAPSTLRRSPRFIQATT